MKSIFALLVVLSLIGAPQLSAEEVSKVNVSNLVVMLENLFKELKVVQEENEKLKESNHHLSQRVDNISNQSYEAKIATEELQEKQDIIYKKMDELVAIARTNETLSRVIEEAKKAHAADLENDIKAIDTISNTLSYTAPKAKVNKDKRYYTVIAKGGLRVRKAATKNSYAFKKLRYRTSIYADCSFGNWCYAEDLKGYVSRHYLTRGRK